MVGDRCAPLGLPTRLPTAGALVLAGRGLLASGVMVDQPAPERDAEGVPAVGDASIARALLDSASDENALPAGALPNALAVPLEAALPEAGCVADGEAPLDSEDVAVPVPEPVAERVALPVGVALSDEVPLQLAVPLGDAPNDSEGVDDAVSVSLPVAVGDAVAAGAVHVGVCVGDALALKEVEPVLEADAPEVSEAVGVALMVVLPLTVEEGVGAGVPVPLPVAVGVAVLDPV